MGTWGYGLFDGDGPLDAIGDFTGDVCARIEALATAPVNEANAARLAALVGVLFQLQESYAFDRDATHEQILAAIARQSPASTALSAQACRIVRRVHAGGGEALAERYASRPARLKRVLGTYLSGLREPALFEHPAAARELSSLLVEPLRAIDEELAGADDIYDLSGGLAYLALPLLLDPCWVDPQRYVRWQRRIKAIHAKQDPDADRDFWLRYLANLELLFKHAAQTLPATRPSPPPALAKRPSCRERTPWRHLVFGDDKPTKFWSIARHDHGFTVHFGRFDTPGQERTTWCGTPERAEAQVARQTASKLAKGYAELS